MAHPRAKQNSAGRWDCPGVCHDGKGETGLFYAPDTNQAYCNSHCEQSAILKAFRLPEAPDVHDEDPAKASETEQLILDPANTLPSAEKFVELSHQVDSYRALQHQAGVFLRHDPAVNSYLARDEAAIRKELYYFLQSALRWTEPKRENEVRKLVPFKTNKSKTDNVLDALRAVCNLPASSVAPCWLEKCSIDPFEVMACRNGLLHLPSRRLIPPTPKFFTVNSVNFGFDPSAPHPQEWLTFLGELWEDDSESISLLQEWFGYLLTPQTHFQKMLMMVGPKRSGKGTIARVLRMLLGELNVCGPTLANMAEQFGLSILIGKTAAIVADARIGGRTDVAVITERLLSISGEDTLSIPRKYLTDWTGKLSARFMLLTNELPRIEDASGALASRFLTLMLTQSFYGREDHHLLEKFIPEMPGILLWAIAGWERLQKRGRFVQPQSSSELVQEFEDLGSPVGAFIRDRCEVGRANSVPVDRIFEAWKSWCTDNGRENPGTKQTFGTNLRAIVPWLRMERLRVAGDRVRYYEGIRLKEEY
jgi:putative DNA primase/helicase